MPEPKLNDITADYARWHDTGHRNRYAFPNLTYSDGVQAITRAFRCNWMICLVFYHQMQHSINKWDYQEWTFTVEGGKVTASVSNGVKPLGSMPMGKAATMADCSMTFILADKVLYLPSEYENRQE